MKRLGSAELGWGWLWWLRWGLVMEEGEGWCRRRERMQRAVMGAKAVAVAVVAQLSEMDLQFLAVKCRWT